MRDDRLLPDSVLDDVHADLADDRYPGEEHLEMDLGGDRLTRSVRDRHRVAPRPPDDRMVILPLQHDVKLRQRRTGRRRAGSRDEQNADQDDCAPHGVNATPHQDQRDAVPTTVSV